MMIITQVSEEWWILTSNDGYRSLTWFGYSRPEVVGKFNAYTRKMEVEKLRCC